MKTKKNFYLRILLLLLLPLVTACEVKMAPSDGWSTWFKTQSDSSYYKGKAENLVKKLSRDTFEYEISRVAVIDPVNAEQKQEHENKKKFLSLHAPAFAPAFGDRLRSQNGPVRWLVHLV